MNTTILTATHHTPLRRSSHRRRRPSDMPVRLGSRRQSAACGGTPPPTPLRPAVHPRSSRLATDRRSAPTARPVFRPTATRIRPASGHRRHATAASRMAATDSNPLRIHHQLLAAGGIRRTPHSRQSRSLGLRSQRHINHHPLPPGDRRRRLADRLRRRHRSQTQPPRPRITLIRVCLNLTLRNIDFSA